MARLQRLGTLGYRVDQLPGGVSRATLLLPNGEEGRSQHIEATGVSDGAALLAALARAETLATRGR